MVGTPILTLRGTVTLRGWYAPSASEGGRHPHPQRVISTQTKQVDTFTCPEREYEFSPKDCELLLLLLLQLLALVVSRDARYDDILAPRGQKK